MKGNEHSELGRLREMCCGVWHVSVGCSSGRRSCATPSRRAAARPSCSPSTTTRRRTTGSRPSTPCTSHTDKDTDTQSTCTAAETSKHKHNKGREGDEGPGDRLDMHDACKTVGSPGAWLDAASVRCSLCVFLCVVSAGFRTVKEVTSELQHLPDLLVWGGIGTRMDAQVGRRQGGGRSS